MEDKIRSILKKSKTKCQYIILEDDRVYIGIRETISSNPRAYRTLQSIGLTPINCTYGRWTFKINNYHTRGDLDE